MTVENRRYERFPVEMRVKARLPTGDIEAYTSTVSSGGFGLRLEPPPELEQRISFIVYLPTNRALLGRGTCRNIAGGVCGFEVEFDEQNRPHWDSFISQEESTGSLWRMIGRYTSGDGGHGSARELVYEDDSAASLGVAAPVESDGPLKLRFHTVGENGEAYRVCFEKHPHSAADQCDLASLPGFKELAGRAITRVLDQPVIVRQGTHAAPQKIRVVELTRGGYAYVQGGTDGRSVGLVSLGLGETILIEVNGQSVFPHFEHFDLERVACDTFRQDSTAPMFGPSPSPQSDDDDGATEGRAAIQAAQARATQVERRHYGDREIELFPQVWVRAKDKDDAEVMGPSMRDGDRVLLLALVGPGAPRVVRVSENTPCSLMQARQ